MGFRQWDSDSGIQTVDSDNGMPHRWQLLCKLPHVGATRASQILMQRERLGELRSVDDLFEMDGFGPTVIEDMLPFITFQAV